MITKKEFSQALTDNASVAEGLVPVVSPSVKGKADHCFYKKTFFSSLNITYLIAGEKPNNTSYFIEVINISNTMNISPEITFITISYHGNGLIVRAHSLIKNTQYNIKIYKSGNNVFFKTTNIGGHIHFIGANVIVTEMELPQDAEEITVL